MSTIKERPILFSGAMVRALLNGSKTQTRRAVKWPIKSPTHHISVGESDLGPIVDWCPYGQPGDRLWVRESCAFLGERLQKSEGVEGYLYRADSNEFDGYGIKWKPSIHMPRAASRLLLEIVAVRCERLQDISEDDAVAEGVSKGFWGVGEWKYPQATSNSTPPYSCIARSNYASLWQEINGPNSWAANPWVWVVTFKIVPTYTVLTQPDTSTAVARAGVKIGTVTCINTARPSEPVALRYYGQNANGSASGQAHETQAQAVADVEAWADGKEVSYPKQACVSCAVCVKGGAQC
jgi:hypothetical protein